MMKILLDENLLGSKEYFRLLGHEVSGVDDHGLKTATDDVLIRFAKDNDYFIITKDRKMEEKCQLLDVPCFLISDSWVVKKVNDELLKRNHC